MNALECQQVGKDYAAAPGAAPRRVLDGVDLALEAGHAAALVGPSGAGKTTLLCVAAGLTRPDRGRVTFEGTDLARLGEGARDRLRREKIALVFQNSLCLSALPAWENVALPMLLAGRPMSEARRAAGRLMEALELQALIDAPTQALSGGQRQRLGLARAMAMRPSLLLADEPTADLDAATAERVEARLFDWIASVGCAALIATHAPSIEQRAGRVLRLEDGRLAEAATRES
jgi:predicted ABC-type transport system involved in lysophospholipase L1 biosynthesis ATPase subunit